jgi:hypothetical protein
MATIAEAAATGDRRATLEAMRAKLAQDMDDAPPAVVAQIAGRLSAILVELAELPNGEKVSTLDELVARRTDRLAKAAGVELAKRSTRQRRA